MKTKYALLPLLLLGASAPALAVEVVWADWQSVTGNTVSGTLATETPIDINYTNTAGFQFVQTGSSTDSNWTNYWTEPNPASRPYTGGVVENAPLARELIALTNPGTSTITFSAPITGLYFAIISWNGNDATFDRPFEIISQGQGYWGTGTITPETTDDGYVFKSTGEPHAIIYFPGTFSSLTFKDTRVENWHGITVGVERLATDEEIAGMVPEPASWAMMIAGFGLAGFAMRSRRRVAATFA